MATCMKKKNFSLILFLFFLSFSGSIRSEEEAWKVQLTSNDTVLLTVDQVIPDAFPKISVIFLAETQKGIPLWNIDITEMKVYEDSVECEIKNLQRISKEKPVNLALVVDHSGSMAIGNAFSNAKRAIFRFLTALNTQKDSVMVVGFSTKVDGITPLSSDTVMVKKELNRYVEDGTTAFYDAISLALDSLKNHSGLKAVVALTDGNDNSSLSSIEAITKKAQENSIPLYIIGLGIDVQTAALVYYLYGIPIDYVDRDKLSNLAKLTGGNFYFTKSSKKLTEIYTGISRRIKALYELVYFSPNKSYRDTIRTIGLNYTNDKISFSKPQYASYALSCEIVRVLKNRYKRTRIMITGGLALAGLGSGLVSIWLIFRRKRKDEKEPEKLDEGLT